MTARTSTAKKNQLLQMAGKLSGQFAKATSLVLEGKRTPEEISVLNKALQLFREGKLTLTTIKAPIKKTTQVQSILSIRIEDLSISDSLKKYLKKRGIFYVGELFLINNDIKAHARADEVKELILNSLGLPLSLNVHELWIPPYWSDEEFQDALSRPINELIDNRPLPQKDLKKYVIPGRFITDTHGVFLISRKVHYGNQYINWVKYNVESGRHDLDGNWSITELQKAQSLLLPNSGLHAAALPAPNWILPTKKPDAWYIVKTRIETMMVDEINKREVKNGECMWLKMARKLKLTQVARLEMTVREFFLYGTGENEEFEDTLLKQIPMGIERWLTESNIPMLNFLTMTRSDLAMKIKSSYTVWNISWNISDLDSLDEALRKQFNLLLYLEIDDARESLGYE